MEAVAGRVLRRQPRFMSSCPVPGRDRQASCWKAQALPGRPALQLSGVPGVRYTRSMCRCYATHAEATLHLYITSPGSITGLL